MRFVWIVLLALLAPAAYGQESHPFDLVTSTRLDASGTKFNREWRQVESAFAKTHRVLAACREHLPSPSCTRGARRFLDIVEAVRRLSGDQTLIAANALVNRAVDYEQDLLHWGVPDRWSPPLETFKDMRGDCEDYAIAKYVVLLEAGISPDRLRLITGRLVPDREAEEGHAVLAAELDGRWLILDTMHPVIYEDVVFAVEPVVVERDHFKIAFQGFLPQYLFGKGVARAYLEKPVVSAR